MQLAGSNALITGSASGIGRSLAVALAREGADLALLDVDLGGASATADQVRAEGRRAEVYGADVGDREAVERAVGAARDDLGPIALACANAGVCPMAPLLEMEPNDVEWLMGVNLFGVMHTARAYVAAARGDGGGHLLLTGSENSVSLPHAFRHAGLGVYSMTKHAVLAMGESLRYELAEHGIGVSLLLPGPVQTSIGESGRNRPEHLGGPTGPVPLDASRLDPEIPVPPFIAPEGVARIAIEGLRAGRFMIPTHAHIAEYAAARLDELERATRETRLET